MTIKYYVYSDIDQTLANNFVFDVSSVKQSINTILTTRRGQRLFLSQYGTDIEEYLFDFTDTKTANEIYVNVINAITRWEPRVLLDIGSGNIVLDPINQKITIKLVYQIVGLNGPKFEYIVGMEKS
jgi:phage baseplate assembly protein W